jgi:hypothetical protein
MDIGKQQQLNQWPDRHEFGSKTTATATTQFLTLIASATCTAPSLPISFEERSKLVIALLLEWGVSRCPEGIFKNLRALGNEGSNHDCPG